MSWLDAFFLGALGALGGDVTGSSATNVVTSIRTIATPTAAPSAGQFMVAGSPTALTYRSILAADLPSLAGDVTGAYGTTVVAKINGTAVPIKSSLVTGDLLTYNGTAWVRLPIGTNTQVLTMVAGLPAWAAAGAGVTWAGDLAGSTSTSQTVAKINGITVPAGAPGAAGQFMVSSSISALTYRVLAAGDIPAAASITMAGDVTGTSGASTVVGLTGTTNVVAMHAATLVWDAASGAPAIYQATQATTGKTFTIQAAPVTTGTGSNLLLQSGGGSVAAGNVVIQTGSVTGFTVAPTLVSVATSLAVGTTPASAGALRLPNNNPAYARNAGNTADVILAYLDGGNRVVLGDATNASTVINAGAGGVLFQPNGGLPAFTVLQTSLTWDAAATATYSQAQAAGTAAGLATLIKAQAAGTTAAAGVLGGSLLLRAGDDNGVGAGVARAPVVLQSSGGAEILRAYNDGSAINWLDFTAQTSSRIKAVQFFLQSTGSSMFIDCLGASAATNFRTGPGGSFTAAQFTTTGVQLFGTGVGAGSGTGVLSITNATTLPTTNPTGGGLVYVNNGALVYRGSSGTVTTLAPA